MKKHTYEFKLHLSSKKIVSSTLFKNAIDFKLNLMSYLRSFPLKDADIYVDNLYRCSMLYDDVKDKYVYYVLKEI